MYKYIYFLILQLIFLEGVGQLDYSIFNDSIFSGNRCEHYGNFTIIGEMHFRSEQTSLVQFEVIKNKIKSGTKKFNFFLEISPSSSFLISNYFQTGDTTILKKSAHLYNYYSFLTKLYEIKNEVDFEFYGFDLESKTQFDQSKELISLFVYPRYEEKIKSLRIKKFEKIIQCDTFNNCIDTSQISSKYYKLFVREIEIIKEHGFISRSSLKHDDLIRENNFIKVISEEYDSTITTMLTVGRAHLFSDSTDKVSFFVNNLRIPRNEITIIIPIYYYDKFIVVNHEVLTELEEYDTLLEYNIIDCFWNVDDFYK